MRMFTKVAVVSGAAALTIGGISGVALAQEPSTQGIDYVDGFEVYTDDWSDHQTELGVLSEGADNSVGNDTVLLWQSVLAADGYLSGDDITGDFDSPTTVATQHWQVDNGISADGKVGDETWNVADDRLGLVDGTLQYRTEGDGNIVFERGEDEEGAYKLISVTPSGEDELSNVSGAERIEHFDLTIGLG